MIKRKIFLFILFCSVISVYSQQDQSWKWVHQQPQGNNLRWVKMWDHNTWYAIGNRGTFMKTTNAGASWYFHHKAWAPSFGTNFLYSAAFKNKDTGFVCGTVGVLTTIDGGETFQPLAIPINPNITVWYNSFMLDNIAYICGTTSGRLAKSTDGGFSWTLNTNIPYGTYFDVWTPNDTLIIASSEFGNVRRSTNNGNTFTTINTGDTSSYLYKLAFRNADTGYVAGSSGSCKMTTDGGVTWTNINTGLPANATFYDIDINGENIYLTGDLNYIYKSSNNGSSWEKINHLAPSTQHLLVSTYYSSDFLSDRFITVGDYGLINTKIGTDSAVTHTAFKTSASLCDVWANSSSGKVIAVGDASKPGISKDQVLFSTNGGAIWELAHLNSSARFRAIDMIDSLTGFIVGSKGAVYKTIDGGINWEPVITQVASTVTLYDVDFVDHSNGWVVGSEHNVWRTSNGGTTWFQQTPEWITGYINSISMVNDSIGWLGGRGGAINFTTNGGTAWISQISGFESNDITGIKAVNGTTAYICGTDANVAKTTNSGDTWVKLSNFPASSSILYSLDFSDGSNGVVADILGNIISTTDGGLTWSIERTGGGSVYGVGISKTGTSKSVFCVGADGNINKKSDFITSEGNEVEAGITAPVEFAVSQNYPNPFNPVTVIKYAVPVDGFVTLSVYNLLGEKVAQLVNGEVKSGTYEVSFDASGLSSGVYMYKLESGSFTSSKKLVLMK